MAQQITEVKIPVVSALIHEIGQMRSLHKQTKRKILTALAKIEQFKLGDYRKRIGLVMDEPEIDEKPSEMLSWAFSHEDTIEGKEFWTEAIRRLEKAEERYYGMLTD